MQEFTLTISKSCRWNKDTLSITKYTLFYTSEVTIIPTYDSDVLGYWVAENEEALMENRIDLAPSASRCTINLQDHETSCAAYRLEF